MGKVLQVIEFRRNIQLWFAPERIKEDGRTPDYRFSLANERTFLAWLRTSLALIGGGFAVDQFLPDLRWAWRAGLALGAARRRGAVRAAGRQPLGAVRAGDATGRGPAGVAVSRHC